MFTGIMAAIFTIAAAGVKWFLGRNKSTVDLRTLKEERKENEQMQEPVPDKKTVISDLP